jgi:hypothetical protein
MVSVACAAAGIIVGMVTLTGMGLKFSSLVLELSFGIKALAILLIGAASLVLGMGLPVTASYIVLATLAGPALLDMGVPLLVSHMIVFWYSQDANVTPPVSLASLPARALPMPTPCKPPLPHGSWPRDSISSPGHGLPPAAGYRRDLFPDALGSGLDHGHHHHWTGLLRRCHRAVFFRKATLRNPVCLRRAGLLWPGLWFEANKPPSGPV